MFTPQNDPARNLWYWPDAAAMTASAFAAQPVETAPVTIDADASPDPGARPRGGTTRIDLPNRHLEYALTWYGLALTLIGVYAAFVVESPAQFEWSVGSQPIGPEAAPSDT